MFLGDTGGYTYRFSHMLYYIFVETDYGKEHTHHTSYAVGLIWLISLRILKFAEIFKGLCKICFVFNLTLPLYARSEHEDGLMSHTGILGSNFACDVNDCLDFEVFLTK
jgi:hypothetical protein